ncbi:hypothetical protein [Mesorhizobium sp. CO1-1-9]|uniref:hypothetical protein n=1 Tax=Mesorhizobium sp. CO1-1-9 TaxID=2876630 RepID=UPI001CCD6764|nr:hypothetical protein [Mesorhizobium sp. CO1-1-9]MBZ9698737.1 hypothetical protein [Mesorhizobium sp. CO1-1-9]
MAEHLPNAITGDPIAASDLANEAMRAAERDGIDPAEIADEVGSAFEVILEAMQHRDASLAD